MESKYIALNSALLFWLLGLMAWCCESTYLAWLSGSFSLSSFVFHFQYHRINHMFKKNKNVEATPQTVATPVLNSASPLAVSRKPAATVIASGIRFDGNIIAEGDVDIYGTVSGNIDAEESQIKIMAGGLVEGNITCRELIIDGCILGQCRSETIEIDKNGQVTGTLAYRTLAINKGGVFSGQAELLPAAADKSNVVGFIADTAAETKNRADRHTAEAAQ
ncbi:TPA: polymer-forming cytoskeletal protein [Klebsiella michiganensis]|jgi:cytoskeletal protein CcmA (bactofilin family)|uniref:bactofilin family protein n=1 Tax=Klebsiella TaxID=570 RepID=UPI0006671070|nr:MULTISPECIES: polymer-forming cytoskeletal protein [Klebsiella]EKV5143436.1 polymer-forming cytoskeletal protein [Klebsiella michiganensis]ELS0728871.1 polymer-forming cytoskeletal protein [Klebsiella michiganensis]MBA4428023.1 polymer-forming cytoskeletal protein [Klebsiella michiganensis]MBW5960683.1 Ccm protein [Klebsiella michiganensis]MBX8833281.1 polymer-forming cytoskeletal protein [Klebsiella michiganensis]